MSSEEIQHQLEELYLSPRVEEKAKEAGGRVVSLKEFDDTYVEAMKWLDPNDSRALMVRGRD